MFATLARSQLCERIVCIIKLAWVEVCCGSARRMTSKISNIEEIGARLTLAPH